MKKEEVVKIGIIVGYLLSVLLFRAVSDIIFGPSDMPDWMFWGGAIIILICILVFDWIE